MNKWTIRVAAAILASAIAVPGAAGAAEMKAMDDKIMSDGMELVPLREAAESLGYKVQWNEMDRSVLLTADKPVMEQPMTEKPMMEEPMTEKPMEDNHAGEGMMAMAGISVKIGSNTVTVNGMEKMTARPAVIMNDMTYVSKDLIDQYLMSSAMMK